MTVLNQYLAAICTRDPISSRIRGLPPNAFLQQNRSWLDCIEYLYTQFALAGLHACPEHARPSGSIQTWSLDHKIPYYQFAFRELFWPGQGMWTSCCSSNSSRSRTKNHLQCLYSCQLMPPPSCIWLMCPQRGGALFPVPTKRWSLGESSLASLRSCDRPLRPCGKGATGALRASRESHREQVAAEAQRTWADAQRATAALRKDRGFGAANGKGKGRDGCFNCGANHFARDCPDRRHPGAHFGKSQGQVRQPHGWRL